MIRRLLAFLRADTGIARADYAAALLLTVLAHQLTTWNGRAVGTAIRPAFAFLA